ncbi:hypothetical protein ABTZ78_16995 [Streptomyces bauhiniae]|uniref:hypothetical protein n=1 Tax=Streptomyces bauhiniae TaxID=2340725 RepID=UPI00332557D3
MNIAEELYFGWSDLAHGQDCPLPVWDAQITMGRGRRGRLLNGEPRHECTHPECEHATFFTRSTLRLVCHGCNVVWIVYGEDAGTMRTTTEAYGFGQPAREVAGLWLWPEGRPTPGTEPGAYLVTRTPDRPSRPVDVIGRISRYYERYYRYTGEAVPAPQQQGVVVEFIRRRQNCRSVDEAAQWIADQYQPQQVEVAV